MTQTTNVSTPPEPDRIDLLIDQVGRLTEGVTALVITTEQLARSSDLQYQILSQQGNRFNHIDDRLDRLLQGISEQAEIGRQQNERIDRLVQTTEQQGERIERLAQTVERQGEHFAQTAERQQQNIEQLTAAVRSLVERG
ncbi:MAG: hypothetical protein F6J86_42105 [Symploca sp. SIO1B1]|nr:hypothetical protein [Symploca sp. SIO2D2]NES00311.1 hypothetical protein [Symploca sp. SIO1B1]